MTDAELVGASPRTNRLAGMLATTEFVFVTLGMAVVTVLLLRQYRAPGSEMDEGAVLAYSGRVLHGAVPWRDFLTFYGPGNLWLVGGASELFGLSVATERAIGLGYRLVIVLALYLLARRFGSVAGLLALGVCAFLLPGQGITALALYGSLAFVVAGLAALVYAVAQPSARSRGMLAIAAGALFASGLLVRFDLVLAFVLPAAVLLPLLPGRDRLRVLASFFIVAAAYVPQAALAGTSDLKRMLSQLFASEPGRRLPFPSPRGYPGFILMPSIIATILLVAVGAALAWRRREDLEARTLLAAGLLSAALLPTTFSRADDVHVIPGSVVSLALLPALVIVLVRRMRSRRPETVAQLCGYVVPLVMSTVAGLLIAAAGFGAVQDVVRPQSLHAYFVTAGGRSFPLKDRSEAHDAQVVVSAAYRLVKPSERLFVGPADLRRANYNDTFFYYLLPRLQPASFYMEMDPQTANRPGSGLAEQVRTADWLILDGRYDRWSEPNSSSIYGPAQPNRVVSNHFCVVASRGFDTLLRRCR